MGASGPGHPWRTSALDRWRGSSTPLGRRCGRTVLHRRLRTACSAQRSLRTGGCRCRVSSGPALTIRRSGFFSSGIRLSPSKVADRQAAEFAPVLVRSTSRRFATSASQRVTLERRSSAVPAGFFPPGELPKVLLLARCCCKPWSPHRTMIVFFCMLTLVRALSSRPTCASAELDARQVSLHGVTPVVRLLNRRVVTCVYRHADSGRQDIFRSPASTFGNVTFSGGNGS